MAEYGIKTSPVGCTETHTQFTNTYFHLIVADISMEQHAMYHVLFGFDIIICDVIVNVCLNV